MDHGTGANVPAEDRFLRSTRRREGLSDLSPSMQLRLGGREEEAMGGEPAGSRDLS